DMVGGELSIKGTYDDTKPDSPLTGTFLVRQFQMVRAPLMARLLGILSLDGIVSTLSGKGIAFDELVAPFTKTGDDLRIKNAKAYGSALGFTASGWMDLEQDKLDISGTVVPAYTINKILGWIPLLGDVLVGEKGSGVFAATYRMHGPFSDPKVSTNPLATFAPGALRELLGIFDSRREKPPSERKQTGAPPVTKSRPEAPEDTAPLGRVDR
ncbi:MAG TPA: AsmA-like C-terminal domain-containing protein, partial [Alphaproteobacteria bacterium]|nr:AsmA-like C-terminal domain-containing protein [Alphaproteobacteria bacterium]